MTRAQKDMKETLKNLERALNECLILKALKRALINKQFNNFAEEWKSFCATPKTSDEDFRMP